LNKNELILKDLKLLGSLFIKSDFPYSSIPNFFWVTPDKKSFIGGYNNLKESIVKVWELKTGKIIHTFMENSKIGATQISNDGKFLVIGYRNGKINIYELKIGKLIHTLKDYNQTVRSIEISPDIKYIVAGYDDGSIIIWDFLTKKHIYTLKGHKEEVNIITFSPNGEYFISFSLASGDFIANVWETMTGRLIHFIESISSAIFTPDGNYIITGSIKGIIKIRELITGEIIQTIKGHEDNLIFSLSITSDGENLISSDLDGEDFKLETVKNWELKTGNLIYSINDIKNEYGSVGISADGKNIIGYDKDKINLLDINNGQLISTIQISVSYCGINGINDLIMTWDKDIQRENEEIRYKYWQGKISSKKAFKELKALELNQIFIWDLSYIIRKENAKERERLESFQKEIREKLISISQLLKKNKIIETIKELEKYKKITKKEKFYTLIKEIDSLLIEAKNSLRKEKQENIKTELIKIKILLDERRFNESIKKLEEYKSIAERENFQPLINEMDSLILEAKYLFKEFKIKKIKKTILDFSIRFTRLQINEIAEKCGTKDEQMIIDVVTGMIENKEIYAEYFSSSKAIAFDQQANIDEIDKLMEAYKDWEEKKVGKK